MSNIGTILAPKLPNGLPNHCQWLSGQGAGAWFCIDKATVKNQYLIKRFSANGKLDCEGIFEIEDNTVKFDISEPYQFTHISHCAKCVIIQYGNNVVFKCLTT